MRFALVLAGLLASMILLATVYATPQATAVQVRHIRLYGHELDVYNAYLNDRYLHVSAYKQGLGNIIILHDTVNNSTRTFKVRDATFISIYPISWNIIGLTAELSRYYVTTFYYYDGQDLIQLFTIDQTDVYPRGGVIQAWLHDKYLYMIISPDETAPEELVVFRVEASPSSAGNVVNALRLRTPANPAYSLTYLSIRSHISIDNEYVYVSTRHGLAILSKTDLTPIKFLRIILPEIPAFGNLTRVVVDEDMIYYIVETFTKGADYFVILAFNKNLEFLWGKKIYYGVAYPYLFNPGFDIYGDIGYIINKMWDFTDGMNRPMVVLTAFNIKNGTFLYSYALNITWLPLELGEVIEPTSVIISNDTMYIASYGYTKVVDLDGWVIGAYTVSIPLCLDILETGLVEQNVTTYVEDVVPVVEEINVPYEFTTIQIKPPVRELIDVTQDVGDFSLEYIVSYTGFCTYYVQPETETPIVEHVEHKVIRLNWGLLLLTILTTAVVFAISQSQKRAIASKTNINYQVK